MRIENISGTMLRIHGMKVAPGREATIEAGRVPPGFRRVPDLPKVLTAHELLVQRIRFNRGGPRGLALTKRGKPRCDVLSRDMGRTVRAKQRDAAWREVKTELA